MWYSRNSIIVKRKGGTGRCSRQKKKHTQEMRATKLTYNQTVCPHFQQQHGHVDRTTLCD